LPLLVIAGVYLLDRSGRPCATVDDDGVERRAVRRRRWPWERLGTFRIDPRLRSAWIVPRGRGTARFLPPVLLLWEPGEGADAFATTLAALLSAHLPGRSEQ
jgi:hypothetical protein